MTQMALFINRKRGLQELQLTSKGIWKACCCLSLWWEQWVFKAAEWARRPRQMRAAGSWDTGPSASEGGLKGWSLLKDWNHKSKVIGVPAHIPALLLTHPPLILKHTLNTQHSVSWGNRRKKAHADILIHREWENSLNNTNPWASLPT